MEAASIAALLAFLTVVVQAVANYLGAQRAREHEIALMKLRHEFDEDDDKKDE